MSDCPCKHSRYGTILFAVLAVSVLGACGLTMTSGSDIVYAETISDDGEISSISADTATSYRIVYSTNYGNGLMETSTVSESEEYTIADCDFKYNGHRFKEWQVVRAEGIIETYSPGEVVTDLSDGADEVTLTAVWESSKDPLSNISLVAIGAAAFSSLVLIAALGIAITCRKS